VTTPVGLLTRSTKLKASDSITSPGTPSCGVSFMSE
jgi:hypothetical protein